MVKKTIGDKNFLKFGYIEVIGSENYISKLYLTKNKLEIRLNPQLPERVATQKSEFAQ